MSLANEEVWAVKSGLLLVDIQNDYFPGGSMELVAMDSAAETAAGVLGSFRQRGQPVYHVQHLSIRPGAVFFVPGTAGVEIHSSVVPQGDEPIFQKNFPNSFRGTELLERLRADGIERLVICGAMSHMCIDATTRAAFDLGFACAVVSDACATRDLEFGHRAVSAADVHAAFMAALAVPYATVAPAAEIAMGDDA